jgi:uncharacterized membrane protein
MYVFLNYLVEIITSLLNLAGILFILWGGLEAALRVTIGDLRVEKDEVIERQNRKAFASKLLLGLEFFIAVDILNTFAHSTWDSLGRLLALIVIRALLGFVLSHEMGSSPIASAKKKGPKR